MASELPRSMRDPSIREERRAMLDRPHIAPLARYAQQIREHKGIEVPDFDPEDGGTQAHLLFLLEKPGPMTARQKAGRAGSGFISRDNDDPTAEATFDFMLQAGIPRSEVVLWNVIPGWNGTRKVTASELRDGIGALQGLLRLLPRVRAIVLVGQKAAKAGPHIRDLGLAVFQSPHPSPIVRSTNPAAWRSIPDHWARAYDSL